MMLTEQRPVKVSQQTSLTQLRKRLGIQAFQLTKEILLTKYLKLKDTIIKKSDALVHTGYEVPFFITFVTSVFYEYININAF